MDLKKSMRRGVAATCLGLLSIPVGYFAWYNLESLWSNKPYMYNIEHDSMDFLGNGSLAEKAAIFQEQFDTMHVTPEGLVQSNGAIALEENDHPVGDSMLMTSLYLMSQVYRYKVTNDGRAKENIGTLVGGLHRLFEVTGKSGFPARFLAKKNAPANHGSIREGAGEYSDYVWVGDTSRDQYIGLLAAYSLCYDLVDDDRIREVIRVDVSDLAHHLLDNDWKLVDPEGETTRHGSMYHFFPVNTLNVLKSAAHITGGERFKREYEKWSSIYSSTSWPTVFDFKVNAIFHNRNYNDNISMLCYYNLLSLEDDAGLRDYYLRNMDRMWGRSLQGEGNSFFNFMRMATCNLGDYDPLAVNEGLKSLDLFPVEREDFEVVDPDSLETRIAFSLSSKRFRRVITNPLPINERRFGTTFVWQGCPYETGEGNGDNTEYARIDYSIAYWMGRYHGFINEED